MDTTDEVRNALVTLRQYVRGRWDDATPIIIRAWRDPDEPHAPVEVLICTGSLRVHMKRGQSAVATLHSVHRTLERIV